ncbi:RNA pseudouridine synthase [Chromatiales bacterium (ex Bugula neritina AB1)]|nr:RNA pseudouridine synthase [Chromatiales bacterium (ex Bugula neritina AB1)]
MAGSRFDRVVADLLEDYSRARLQTWIKQGLIVLDGQTVPPRQRVKGGEIMGAELPELASSASEVAAEPISFDIVFEDDQVIVINKPPGMVMHTAPGNYAGTMQNGLLNYAPQLSSIPRAGIVHRLDKDTSGLVMIAKTLTAHNSLVQQLQDRRVHRVYDAILTGVPVAGGTINEPIGRHQVDRKRMAVTERGKSAVTHYRIAEKFPRHCHVRVKLETGRTHQIRVHLSHIQYPLVGDTVYGGRRKIPAGVSDLVKTTVVKFPRQALNASELGIVHPVSGEEVRWNMDLPEDMNALLETLRAG